MYLRCLACIPKSILKQERRKQRNKKTVFRITRVLTTTASSTQSTRQPWSTDGSSGAMAAPTVVSKWRSLRLRRGWGSPSVAPSSALRIFFGCELLLVRFCEDMEAKWRRRRAVMTIRPIRQEKTIVIFVCRLHLFETGCWRRNHAQFHWILCSSNLTLQFVLFSFVVVMETKLLCNNRLFISILIFFRIYCKHFPVYFRLK